MNDMARGLHAILCNHWVVLYLFELWHLMSLNVLNYWRWREKKLLKLIGRARHSKRAVSIVLTGYFLISREAFCLKLMQRAWFGMTHFHPLMAFTHKHRKKEQTVCLSSFWSNMHDPFVLTGLSFLCLSRARLYWLTHQFASEEKFRDLWELSIFKKIDYINDLAV